MKIGRILKKTYRFIRKSKEVDVAVDIAEAVLPPVAVAVDVVEGVDRAVRRAKNPKT